MLVPLVVRTLAFPHPLGVTALLRVCLTIEVSKQREREGERQWRMEEARSGLDGFWWVGLLFGSLAGLLLAFLLVSPPL